MASLSSSSSNQVNSQANSRYSTRRFRNSSTSKQAASRWLRDGAKNLNKTPWINPFTFLSVDPHAQVHLGTKICHPRLIPLRFLVQQPHYTTSNPFEPFSEQAAHHHRQSLSPATPSVHRRAVPCAGGSPSVGLLH